MSEVHPTVGDGNRRCERCGSAMPARTHRQKAADGRMACPKCVGLNVPDWTMPAAAASREHPVGASLTADEHVELRRRLAEAQRSILAARPQRRVAAQVLDARADLARRHLVEAHGWSEGSVVDLDHPTLRSLHRGLLDETRAGGLSGDFTHDEFGRPHTARQVLAHESPDDVVLSHCPWCGSGQLVGMSDGSSECGYCQRVFTCRLQPSFPTMPQTMVGLPPDPAALMGQQAPPAALPPGPGGPAGVPDVLVGPDGQPMPTDQYIAALAVRHGLVPRDGTTEILDNDEQGANHVVMATSRRPSRAKDFIAEFQHAGQGKPTRMAFESVDVAREWARGAFNHGADIARVTRRDGALLYDGPAEYEVHYSQVYDPDLPTEVPTTR